MPTVKQRVAIEKAVENGGNLTQAMLAAQYSPATANNPQNLTKSKAWSELIEKRLPDNKLLRRHNQLLDKKEFFAVGDRGDRHLIETGEIDPQAVARGLDMAYKLKRKYPAERSGGDTNVAVINVIKFDKDQKDKIEAILDANVA